MALDVADTTHAHKIPGSVELCPAPPRTRFPRPFWFLVIPLLVATVTVPARAADSESAAVPTRVVSVPLDPPRGEFALEVGYGYRTTTETFGSDGFPVQAEAGARWTVQAWEVAAAYGLTDRTSLHVTLPVLRPSLDHEGLESPITNPGPAPGDTSIEAHWRFRERRRPYGAWVAMLHVSAPTGVDAPGSPGSALVTGTGIPELGVGLMARRQLGPAAVRLACAYVLRIAQVVPYATAEYPDGTTGLARLHPGNAARAGFTVELEPRPILWMALDATAEWQGAYRLGTTSARWFPSTQLEPTEGTERLYLSAGADAAFPLTDTVTVTLFGRYRFFGKTLPEFAALGLEAFSPPPGLWAGGAVGFRF